MAVESDAGLASPEVDAPVILAFAFGFIAFVAISLVLLGVFYRHSDVGGAPPPRRFPTPRLETRSGQTLDALRKSRAMHSLERTAADREPARIPISRAMDVVAARASKAYDPPDPPSNPASAAP